MDLSYFSICVTIFGIFCHSSAQIPKGAASCPKPVVLNGRYNFEGVFAIITCDEGYERIGPKKASCISRRWVPSIRNIKCERKIEENCPPPPVIAHSQVIPIKNDPYVVGDELRIHCDRGYKPVRGNDYLRCVEGPKWDGVFPVCEAELEKMVEGCPQPPNISHAQIPPPKNGLAYVVGEELPIRCDRNHRIVKGSGLLRCIEGAVWDGPFPSCEETCSDLPDFQNGEWRYRNLKDYEAFFVCDKGFQLVRGIDGKKCINGNIGLEWLGWNPVCEKIEEFEHNVAATCPSPPKLANGKIFPDKVGAEYYPGEEVNIVCNPTYFVIGPTATFRCQDDGTWDDEFNDCEEITCEAPEQPDGGTIEEVKNDPNRVFKFADMVTYICDEGYQLIGNKKRTCSDMGWSHNDPACVKIQCGLIPALDYSRPKSFNAGKTWLPGEEMQLECLFGFRPVNTRTRLHLYCDENGQWDLSAAQCEDIVCEPPEEIPNGRIHFDAPDNRFTQGVVITYSCRNNLILVGKATVSCTEKGWSEPLPECKDLFCDLPELDEGVSIQNNPGGLGDAKAVPFGTVIIYECKGDNYNLMGSASQRCTEDGWTGRTPFCKLLGCPLPKNPENGYLSKSWRPQRYYAFRQVATFKCNWGYKIVERDVYDSSKAICNDDGSWTEIPKCIEIFCTLPPPVNNGRYINQLPNEDDKYHMDYVITLKCDDGYALATNIQETRKCASNGKWSFRQQICEKIQCEVPPDFPHAIRETEIYMSNAYNLRNSHYRQLKKLEAGFKVHFRCQDRYHLIIAEGAQPEIECLKTGQWSEPHFKCESVSCGRLPWIRNGLLRQTEDDDRAIVSCDDSFLATKTEIYCRPDGKWDVEENICQKPNYGISCGQPPRITNGYLSLEGYGDNFPVGSRAIVSCYGSLRPTKTELYCREDGQWDLDHDNLCQNANLAPTYDCGPVPSIPNGYLFVKQNGRRYSPNTRAKVSCYENVRPLREEVFCGHEGRWIVPENLCRITRGISCGQPPRITNGYLSLEGYGDNFPVGSRAIVSCYGSLRPTKTELYCREDGQWDIDHDNLCQNKKLTTERQCGPAPLINNGKVNPPAGMEVFPVGTQANVICEKDFFSNSYIATCEKNGAWNLIDVNCHQQGSFCDSPPSSPNVVFNESSSRYFYPLGHQITYSCTNTRYVISGYKQNQCTENGWRYKTSPNCTAEKCDSIPELKYGTVRITTDGPLRPHEFSVRVECSPGYSAENKHFACDETGKWHIKCERDKSTDCAVPDEIVNGFISKPRNSNQLTYRLEQTVTYSCNNDYKLVGEATRVCTEGGWSGDVPVCKPRFCLAPKVNGRRDHLNRRFRVGEVFERPCPAGEAVLTGSGKIECLDGGIWSDELPDCHAYTKIPCPREPYSDDRGFFEPFNQTFIKLVCPEGTIPLNSNSTSGVCDDRQGTWDIPVDALCVPFKSNNSCSRPEEVPNAEIDGLQKGKEYKEGDQLTLNCDKGFNVVGGVDEITCLKNGYWDRSFGSCSAATCERPSNPKHGEIEPKLKDEAQPFGRIVNVHCDYGFKLTGNSVLRCTDDGWDNPVPSCRKIMCPNPGTPDNGWYHGSFNFRDRVTFGCFSGYKLYGPKERICMENGKWSGSLTVCDANKQDCPEPGTPIHGIKTGFLYNEGDLVTYACESSFTLVGSRTRTCKNRKWTGQEPQCIGRYDFDDAHDVSENLRLLVTNLNKKIRKPVRKDNNPNSALRAYDGNQDILLVVCYLLDSSASIGPANFKKSVNLAKAISQNLGVLPNGAKTCAVTFDTKPDLKIPPTEFDSVNSTLNALDSLVYKEGRGTSLDSAFELLEEKVLNETTRTNPDRKVWFVTFLFTDGKVKQNSRLRNLVRHLRNEYSSPVFSFALTGFPNKDILFDITNSYRNQKRTFLLDSYSTMDKITKDFSGNNKIDYSICGKGFDQTSVVEDFSPSNETAPADSASYQLWPWTVQIFYVKDKKSATARCLGSLISANMVLTSSLCFKKDEDPNRIFTKSGVEKFHVSYAEKLMEVGAGPVASEAIVIKLKKPVTFSKYVRPVCLPETNVDEIANPSSSSVGYASAWSKNIQEDRHGNIPKVYFKIVSNDECQESCKGLNSDKRELRRNLICTANPDVSLDVCGPDSGSPLFQYHSDSSNRPRWVQIGIAMAFERQLRGRSPECYNPSNHYNIFLNLKSLSRSIKEIIENL